MATWRQVADSLAIGLAISYPFAVYFGLQVLEPRTLGLLLMVVILLRQVRMAGRFMAGMSRAEWLVFIALCGLAASIMLSNEAGLLLLYPVAISLSMLFVFARTLRHPPSMIERIARLSEPDLPEEAVDYTRKVTWVWCGFFLFNSVASAISISAPREYWMLYNGFISYVLMGLLFGGEWLVRQRTRARMARGGQ